MHSKRAISVRICVGLFFIGAVVGVDYLVDRWMQFDAQHSQFSNPPGSVRVPDSTASPGSRWGHSDPPLQELEVGQVVQLAQPPTLTNDIQYFPNPQTTRVVSRRPVAVTAPAHQVDPGMARVSDIQAVSGQQVPDSSAANRDAVILEEPIATGVASENLSSIALPAPTSEAAEGVASVDPPAGASGEAEAEPELLGSGSDPGLPTTLGPPMPNQLAPSGASPLADQEALRAVIREEMPDASVEEIEIWTKELQSLPIPAIRDLFKMRRRFAFEDTFLDLPDRLLPGPAIDVEVPPLNPPARIPETMTPPLAPPVLGMGPGPLVSPPTWNASPMLSDSDLLPVANLHQQIKQFAVRNLSNLQTYGYKRLLARTVLIEHPHELWGGAPQIVVDVDMSPGELESTGQNWDLAIQGPGLFVVKHHGKSYYTRSGRFHLNERGQLQMSAQLAQGVLQLEGLQRIPEDAESVVVTRRGELLVGTANGESQVAGRIQLARFRNPTRLHTRGILFEATSESGPAELVDAGRDGVGSIVQGALERSNVRADYELKQVRTSDELLSRLQADVPAGMGAPTVLLDPSFPPQ